MLLAGSLYCSPVFAGAKIIHVGVSKSVAAKAFRGPRILRYGAYRPRWRYLCCVTLQDRVERSYFNAPQPWNERNYLRGPDFPPVNDAIQSHLRPGRTIPNAENIYRQRIEGGRTVEQGSQWAGTFRGGWTAGQGSPWRNRLGY